MLYYFEVCWRGYTRKGFLISRSSSVCWTRQSRWSESLISSATGTKRLEEEDLLSGDLFSLHFEGPLLLPHWRSQGAWCWPRWRTADHALSVECAAASSSCDRSCPRRRSSIRLGTLLRCHWSRSGGWPALLATHLRADDPLLHRIRAWFPLTRFMPKYVFHIIWTSLFEKMQPPLRAALQREYFFVVNGIWSAHWRAAPDRIAPASEVVY